MDPRAILELEPDVLEAMLEVREEVAAQQRQEYYAEKLKRGSRR